MMWSWFRNSRWSSILPGQGLPAKDSIPAQCLRLEYNYTPLDTDRGTIRVLQLSPDKSSEGLRCRMREITMTSASYEALSYTWDSKLPYRCIEVDGRCVIVGNNLFNALFHLRFTDRPRVLWINAICIHQEDIFERDRQVVLMKDIYNHAERVVVWLGVDQPVGYIKSILQAHPAGRMTSHKFECEGLLRREPSTETYVEEIISSRWFTHAWIL